MRCLLIHELDENDPQAWNPSQQFQTAMGAFIGEVAAEGLLLTAEGVGPSSQGALVRKARDGVTAVTDGPFAEAREVIGGFALVEVESKQQAIPIAERFASLFEEVTVEVRPVAEFDDEPEQG